MQGQLERTGNRTNKNSNLARARDEGDVIDTIFGFERFKQVSDWASLHLLRLSIFKKIKLIKRVRLRGLAGY